ncbi:IS3 family transposase [Rhodococcus sp. B7740]|uniref:IS3 family transposase n=1 Tax=Rhodococcus sp. B7740 TaxID=1564114 RepID=UPI003FA6C952
MDVVARSGDRTQELRDDCSLCPIIENFVGHLKEEMFHHTRYSDLDALHTAIEDVDWFNNDHISLRLDGLRPVRAERMPSRPTIFINGQTQGVQCSDRAIAVSAAIDSTFSRAVRDHAR